MSLFSSGNKGPPSLWQDREIRFDAKAQELELRPGEHMVYTFGSVNDTKGNDGTLGELRVTNLRVLWVADSRTNLSIGLGCVLSISLKVASTRRAGSMKSVFLLTKYSNQRFEFILSPKPEDAQKAAALINYAFSVYDKSRMYRDLKVRGATVENRTLKVLDQETVYITVEGIHNLGGPDPINGIMVMTNVRVVWFSLTDDKFNVSVPYVQMRSAKLTDSSYGQVLKIETSPQSGDYKLGFKQEPRSALDNTVEDLSRFLQVYSSNPMLDASAEPTPEQVEEIVANYEANKNTSNGAAAAGDSAGVLQDVDEDDEDTRAPDRDPDDVHSPRLERMHRAREGFSYDR